MRIVVLGSTGQIGSSIISNLRDDYPSSQIVACSRKTIPGHFSFNPFTDNWEKLGKTDVLINSVGIIKENANFSFRKIHVGLTELILKNRNAIGAPRIIQLSVNGADASSKSGFLNTKAESDKILTDHENTVVVRPSLVCT